MRCEYAHDDGAYVLGALTPGERSSYERHLAGCPGCRKAVAELAVLPGLLTRLDLTTAERVTRQADAVEASRLPRLLRAAEEARRRIRVRRRFQVGGAGLAAACLMLVVGFGVAALDRPSAPVSAPPAPVQPTPSRTLAMAPMIESGGFPSPVIAEIGLTEVEAGTKVKVRCIYPPSSDEHGAYPFRLVAYDIGNQADQIGSWRAEAGEQLTLEGITRFTPGELDRVELQSVKYDETLLVYAVA